MIQTALVSWLRRHAPGTLEGLETLSALDCANALLMDLDGRLLGWSGRAETTYGWTVHEAVGKLARELLHTRYPDSFEAVRDQLLRESHWEGEVRHYRRDGAELVFATQWVLQRSTHGRPAVIIEIDCEITHLRRAEEALRQSEEMLRIILDTIPVRVFWKDRNSVYLGCNTLFARDAGLGFPDELSGKTDFEMGWRAQAPLYRADDQAVMQSGVPKLNYEEPQTAPDGRSLWLRTSKIPVRDLNGQIVGILGTYEDITERKRAEVALRESEATTKALLSAVPDLLFRVSSEGTYLDYVVTRTDQLAVPPEVFLGRKVTDVLPPEVAGPLMDCTRRALASGEIAVCEYPLEVRGERGWFEARVVPYGSNEVLHIVRDITRRKAAEEALATNEERLRLALEASELGTWDWDLISGTADCSPRWRQVFGLSTEGEVGYADFFNVIHPEDRPLVEENTQCAFDPEGTGEFQIEFRILRPDGAQRWINGRGRAIYQHGSTVPHRFIGTVLDITERKEAERRIKELALFPDESPNPVMRVGEDYRLLYGNESGQPLLEEWGCQAGDFVPPEIQRIVSAALNSGEHVIEELEVGDRIYSFVFTPVRDSGYVNLYGRDITDRKLAERELAHHRDRLEELVAKRTEELRESHDQLRRAERLASLGTLAAGVGHEINNPLNSIMMSAEYALESGDAAEIEEAFRSIVRETQRCAGIVRGLLQFAREERTSKEPGNLHALINRAVEIARTYLPGERLSIKLELAEKLPPVVMNSLEIEQVLLNLLKNAAEAAGPGVEITVRTATAGKYVLLSVSDNGPGVAPENLPRVFDPFFSTRQGRGGTGLGLSISHSIIAEHGGTITVQSPSGQGATFTIRLPASNGSS